MRLEIRGLLVISLGFCLSCTGATNDRLDKMNSTMDRMATQVEADQTFLKTSTEQVQSLNTNSSRIAKETEIYEESIKTLADQMKLIAQSLADFQKMGASFAAILSEAFKPAPAAATSNIDDVIKK